MCVYCMRSGSLCNHCVRGVATGLVSANSPIFVIISLTTVIRTGRCGRRDLKYCNASYPRRLWTLKSGSLDLLEPSGPVQACNGIAFP